MTYLSSTPTVAERTGIAINTLNRYVGRGFVWGPWLKQHGSGSRMQWRPVDEFAAATVAQITPDGGGGSPESTELARLAAVGVYSWYGRAPFVAVALPNVVEPCFSAKDVVTVADDLRRQGLPCVTVMSLEDDSDG